MSESGLIWDDLLREDLGADSDVAADDSSEPVGAGAVAEDGALSAAELAEAGRLVDRLLARRSLSDTTREDLAEMKGDIAEGTLDRMDRDYIRALAKRLGV